MKTLSQPATTSAVVEPQLPTIGHSTLIQRAAAVVSVILMGDGVGLLFPHAYSGARVAFIAPLALHALLLACLVKAKGMRFALGATLIAALFVGSAWQGAALYAAQLAIAYHGTRAVWRQWVQFALGLALALTTVLFWESTGLLWDQFASISWWLSAQLTSLQAAPQYLGTPQIGFPWLILLVAAIAGRVATPGDRLWVRIAVGVLGLATVAASLAFRLPVLAMVGAGAVVFGYDPLELAERKRIRRVIAGHVLLGTALTCLFILTASWTVLPDAPKTAVFVRPGLGTSVVQEIIPYTENEVADARFGLLPRVLRSYGWTIREVDQADIGKALDGASVLVIPNPNQVPDEPTSKQIRSFLDRGASMLVLGDHTDIGNIMKPLDSYLADTSIRFKFDSAIDYVPDGRWISGLRGAWHRSFFGKTNQEFLISIGASLDIGASARVLVSGDRGYSDKGDVNTGPSKLGDMTYQAGEPLGGIVLAAEERVGNGRVVVFGDTSGFQDSSVPINHAWLATFFDDLRSSKTASLPLPSLIAVFAFAASLVGVLLLLQTPFGGLGWLLAASSICTFAIRSPDQPMPDMSKNVAIDMSHWPKAKTLKKGTELYRFAETATRAKTIALETNDFEGMLAAKPKCIVVIAPAKGYSDEEAKQLHSYVEGGGKLIVSANWQNKEAVDNLCDTFRLRLRPGDLGMAPTSRIVDGKLRDRIGISGFDTPEIPDVSFRHANPIDAKDWEPLIKCWGETLAARKRFGRGLVVWFADDAFLTDANLGEQEKVNVTAVRFLVQALDW